MKLTFQFSSLGPILIEYWAITINNKWIKKGAKTCTFCKICTLDFKSFIKSKYTSHGFALFSNKMWLKKNWNSVFNFQKILKSRLQNKSLFIKLLQNCPIMDVFATYLIHISAPCFLEDLNICTRLNSNMKIA